MERYFEICIIISISVLFLVLVKSVYGLAGSLKELEDQAAAENSAESQLNTYRNELIDYMKFHNLTSYFDGSDPELKGVKTSTLEDIVKSHMQDCMLGKHNAIIESIKNDTSTTEDYKETMLGLNGDC
jgi:hypothetical protein